MFMQRYFREATRVGELTRIFLTKLEAIHIKGRTVAGTYFPPQDQRSRLATKWCTDGWRLPMTRCVPGGQTEPSADLFEEGLRTGMLIHPDAMRLVSANLHLIDDEMRNEQRSQADFSLISC